MLGTQCRFDVALGILVEEQALLNQVLRRQYHAADILRFGAIAFRQRGPWIAVGVPLAAVRANGKPLPMMPA